ncbi:hypothetical protein PWT90_04153 [Aphanocladium album]|nr:hypothetical protein PWT90_04153 [Aphanocladium album]
MAPQHNFRPSTAGEDGSKRPHESLSPREDPTDDEIDDQLNNELHIRDPIWPGYDLFSLGHDSSLDDRQSCPWVSAVEIGQLQSQYFGNEGTVDFAGWNNSKSLLDGFAFETPQPGALNEILPLLNPSLPSPSPTITPTNQSNLFIDKSVERYQFKGRLSFKIPESGKVKGYIKFRLCRKEDQGNTKGQNRPVKQGARAKRGRYAAAMPMEHPSYVLPNFGRTTKLAPYDARLLGFYKNMFCSGRTILSTSNFWVTQLLAIADGNECVNKILLASTAAYILDYPPTNEFLRKRANAYHNSATDLLGVALQEKKTRTDPGYRYWKTNNVQSSAARAALANRVAFVEFLALPVSPPVANRLARLYGWLIEGDKREAYKIFGALRAGFRGEFDATPPRRRF